MFHMPSHIGRYEIKTLIGAGGMGSLYLARDTNPNTNRLVALKLLLANLDSGDLRERFAREARALAALNHPNIVDIYDSGEFQGSPFIVMEYVRGETLAEKIKRRAPMSLRQKLKLMIELCSGLDHAHDAGIIHRDIKPANLMVDQYGRLKILDFGIARVSEGLTRAAVQVTQLNMRIGTPGYMSPEQIEGFEIDGRSDIFAVGTVCYELLAYREAFTGTSTRQVENKVLQSQPEPLTSLIPDLDPELEGVVNRALAKDPKDRFQTASSLEEALDRVLWRLGPSKTPVPVAERPTPSSGSTPAHGSRDSRADIAYQRSLALYEEGARDAARRFAIEALAEDPTHEGARDFIQRFGTGVWTPAPFRPAGDPYRAPSDPYRPAVDPYTSGPTVLRTGSYTGATMSAEAETVLSTAPPPVSSSSGQRTGAAARGWRQYRKHIQVAAMVAAIVVLVGGAALLAYWFWTPGPVLTITRPEGGTIQGAGLTCGSGGTDCSAQLGKGDNVELAAEPDEGFVFSGFTGDCAPYGTTRMTVARECGATFTKIPETVATPGIALTIVKPAGGTVLGDGITCGSLGEDCSTEHSQGKVVALKPYADPDYIFKGFTGDCHPRSGETIMVQDRRCGAMFVRRRTATNNTTAPPPPPPTGPTTPAPDRGAGPTTPTPDPLDGRVGNPVPVPEPEVKKEAPPPPSPESIAKEEIGKLLEAYRRAYESLDVSRIKSLYPSAPTGPLSFAFGQFKSAEYTYTSPPEFVDLDPALGTATVKVPARLAPEYKGPKSPPQNLVNLFTLKRTDGSWSIADIQTRPAK